MDGPASALVGTLALGTGTLIAYAAYKNVPVFGPSGILTGALQTGKLQPVVSPTASSSNSSGPASPKTATDILKQSVPAAAKPYVGIWSWVMRNLVGKGIT